MNQPSVTRHISRLTFHASRFTSHASRFVAPFVFLAAFALYLRTTCPTLGGAFDSEEFQHAAYTLGIAHATGYPLYLLIGKIFTTLVPIGNVAYRMNLLSALFTATAVTFVYLSALQLTRRHIASVATAAFFATNVAVWRQAGVASIGPLHLLLLNAILYVLLRGNETSDTTQRLPILVAFLFGLGLTHHRTTLLFALPIALGTWEHLREPRTFVRMALAAALPLLLYLYLPLFGNHSPWYSNTLGGFLSQISGGDAGDYVRTTLPQILDGIAQVANYLHESFGYVGSVLIIVGAISAYRKSQTRHRNLLLGTATLLYALWGTLYAGEPDRYLVLPFAFLIYWFALGIKSVEDTLRLWSQAANASVARIGKWLQLGLALVLVLLIGLPFPAQLRTADWSTFDRVYKTWDEIFTLPIPLHATIVGNWGQLNAMRYMQRVEHRRTDLQLVGTMYDPAPQTDAARAAFADGRAIFLAPGIALPLGEYRYAQLGPLLEVRDAPQMNPPAAPKNIALDAALTLADFNVTTALEPYAPTTRIAPNRTARVTLEWHARDRINDFRVHVRVYDPEARVIAQKDEPPVRGVYPASRWSPGEYVRDVHNIQIPAGTPPGQYTLKVQTLDAETKLPTSDEIALASFFVERATNLSREQVFVAHPLTVALNNSIELWGYGGFDGTHHAGEHIVGNVVFFVRRTVNTDALLTFALRDATGRRVQTWTRAPIAFYPTREWTAGEILKAYYALPLASNLSAGTYILAIGLDALHDLTSIEITP